MHSSRVRILVAAAALVLGSACAKKVGASRDFSTAMADVSATTRELTRTLPGLDAEIERQRAQDPAAAAARIETAVLPLLDHVVGAMDRAGATGRHYLDAAQGDEDATALTKIRMNLDSLAARRDGFAGVRDVYAEEAHLLRAGPLAAADADRLAHRMVDLMSRAAQ